MTTKRDFRRRYLEFRVFADVTHGPEGGGPAEDPVVVVALKHQGLLLGLGLVLLAAAGVAAAAAGGEGEAFADFLLHVADDLGLPERQLLAGSAGGFCIGGVLALQHAAPRHSGITATLSDSPGRCSDATAVPFCRGARGPPAIFSAARHNFSRRTNGRTACAKTPPLLAFVAARPLANALSANGPLNPTTTTTTRGRAPLAKTN